jgi:hypothetical protein
MDASLRPLTVSGANKGRLEERIQECFALHIREHAEREDRVKDGAGNIVGGISIKLKLITDPKGTTNIVQEVDYTPPKRMAEASTAYLREGGFVEWDEPEQQPLFQQPKVRAIDGGKVGQP